jgi:shikimate dehydrogenase
MIDARTRLIGLLGDPVERSLSPHLHNAWFAQHGINAVYVALRVSKPETISAIAGLGFAGANVTVPHKEAAFAAADHADTVAAALGAANVLRVDEGGAIHAFNTDSQGFVAALDRAHPEWRLLRRRHILVAGAGGSARAVCHGLLAAGVTRILLANRTATRAQAMVDLFGPAIVPIGLDEIGSRLGRTDLIINTISNDADIDWPFAAAAARPLSVDLRYGSMESRFLKAARARGCPTLDGLGMLVQQAALSFQHWFGVLPDIDAGYRLLEDTVGAP